LLFLSDRTDNYLQNSSLEKPSLKQLVKWSNPLSTFRLIPARDDLSQTSTIQNLPNSVTQELTLPSTPCLDALSPPSQEVAIQDENSVVYGPQLSSIEDFTPEIEIFSISNVENNSEAKFFDATHFPFSGKALETQTKSSAWDQSAVPVAFKFTTDDWNGPISHEITTRLNLHHLSRSLFPNTSLAIHHSLSPNTPAAPSTFLPSTKNSNSLPTSTLTSTSKPSGIPSHHPTIPKSSVPIPQKTIHHYPSFPAPQITNNHTSDQTPISDPRPKVFGSRKSNQKSQSNFPQTGGIKRKATDVEPTKRPSKFTKADQNVRRESPIRREIPSSSSVNFPVLNTHGTIPGLAGSSWSLAQSSLGQDEDKASDVGEGGAECPATSESDDPGDSDNDSLFDDPPFDYKPRLVHADTQDFALANPIRDKFRKYGKYSQARKKFKMPVRSHTRPITFLVVIHWVNELKRFQYLRDSGKMDEKVVGELHQLLKDIDEHKSDLFLTPKVLGDMYLGRLVSEFRHGKQIKAAKAVADSIVKFWRHRCRDAV